MGSSKNGKRVSFGGFSSEFFAPVISIGGFHFQFDGGCLLFTYTSGRLGRFRLQLNSMFDKESNESQPIFRSYRVKRRSISSFQRRCAKNAPGRSFNCSKGLDFAGRSRFCLSPTESKKEAREKTKILNRTFCVIIKFLKNLK